MDHNNCGKFLKRWDYLTTFLASWETWMQVKKQQLEFNMEQQTGSKLGKEYIKAVYCHPAYLTSVECTSCEMLGWMKQELKSRLPGEISITSDMQMIPPLWQNSGQDQSREGAKWKGEGWCLRNPQAMGSSKSLHCRPQGQSRGPQQGACGH